MDTVVSLYQKERQLAAREIARWWLTQLIIDGAPARRYFRENRGEKRVFKRAIEARLLEVLPVEFDENYRLTINNIGEPSPLLMSALRHERVRRIDWLPRAAMWVRAYDDSLVVIVRGLQHPSEHQLYPSL